MQFYKRLLDVMPQNIFLKLWTIQFCFQIDNEQDLEIQV